MSTVFNRAIELGYNSIQARILSNRLEEPIEVEHFLSASKGFYKLPDLHKLKDAHRGAELIYEAINSDGIIVCNSDYDADGVSAGGFMELILTEGFGVSSDRILVIQNERVFGNGFNQHTLDIILETHDKKPISLIITADHGSADDERYVKLPDEIKLVVTDHHLLQESGMPKRPNAFINPQRPDDEYSRDISGATVIYLVMSLVQALFLQNNKKIHHADTLKNALPIATNTIITDQMSLREPINRQLLKEGLDILNTTTQEPWKSLRLIVDIPRRITSNELGFIIGPLLNAPGRMEKASVSQRFLSTTKEHIAGRAILEMVKLNNERKALQNESIPTAVEQVKMYSKKYKNSIVVVINGAHGVGGIIASNIGEKFSKPIFVLSRDIDGNYVGSARAVLDNVDVEESIRYIKEHYPDILIRGGGHKAAGGCTVNKDKLSDFFSAFDESIVKQMNGNLIVPEKVIDLHVPIDKVGMQLAKMLSELEPYGRKFDKPLLSTEVTIDNAHAVGPLRNHLTLSFALGDGFKSIKAFYPNAASKHLKIKKGDKVTIHYNLNIKVFRKNETADIIVKDMIL